MVTTRSHTVTPEEQSSNNQTAAPAAPPPNADPNTAIMLQPLQRMEQRLANFEACDQLLHAQAAPVIAGSAAPVIAAPTALAIAAPAALGKNPRERIKLIEVPKFDGTDKTEFEDYCNLIQLEQQDHILTAFSIAMTRKAIL